MEVHCGGSWIVIKDRRLDYAFHVHTARCGHAALDSEESYIEYAIKNDMHMITFTDHAPFPGDPFTGRMKMTKLDEYIHTIKELREKYKKYIKIYSGFEVEYIPEYLSYCCELQKKVDFMILGQHHAKTTDGHYTYEKEIGKNKIYTSIFFAVIEGMKTGLFSVLAHPDRYFHSMNNWTEEDEQFKEQIFLLAKEKHIKLEKNLSVYEKIGYNMNFWNDMPEGIQIIYGLDAHSLDDMKRRLNLCKIPY